LNLQLEKITGDFGDSLTRLDNVLARIEQKEVTQVSQIYHPASERTNDPDVIVALAGMFFAARELENLIKHIDSIVAGIADTMTVSRLLQGRE